MPLNYFVRLIYFGESLSLDFFQSEKINITGKCRRHKISDIDLIYRPATIVNEEFSVRGFQSVTVTYCFEK